MEAVHGPRPRRLHSPGRGGMPAAPGRGARWGQAPCPLATNQTKRSLSDRPWHIPPQRGREEEHKPRRDAAGEERQ